MSSSELEATQDDLDFARDTLGPDATEDEVQNLADQRLDRDAGEDPYTDPKSLEHVLGFDPDNQPIPLPNSHAKVTLSLEVDGFHTAQAAEAFHREVLFEGLRHFWLQVTDDNGEEYWVRDGQSYTKQQIEQYVEQQDPGGGEEGD